MTERKLVTIALVDNDSNIPVEDSLVVSFKDIMVEGRQEEAIQQLLVEEDFKKILETHNNKRIKHFNQDILNRTGVEVNLKPVTLSKLSWQVK